ncbi:hypothetical protein [Bradyrhizobium guangxiense]|uniref:hypothetical protein n=1 Tax=Bradyrhizobium guangxiense TaxID=1325115 RepID=UPI003D318E9C
MAAPVLATTTAKPFKLSSDTWDQLKFHIQSHCRPRMSSVQIQCTRCKNVFRDRAGRLQDGYSRQCPSCEVVLFFAEDSQHPFIKRAMRNARKARKEMREAMVAKLAAPEPRTGQSRRFAGRARSGEREG